MPADNRSKTAVVDDQPDMMHSSSRRGVILNRLGLIVLLAGLAGAGIVYWTGTARPARAPAASAAPGEWSDSSLTPEDSKAATRDIELYGGKAEVLMVHLTDAVHRPGPQAILIATASALIALALFLYARHFSA